MEGGRGGVLRGSPAEGEMEPRHGGPPCRARASCPGAPPCRALAPRSPSRRWRKVGRGSTEGERGWPIPPNTEGEGSVLRKGYFSCGLIL